MRKEIGIMLSVGFAISDISKSLILSNIILSLVSFLISVPLSLFVVKWWFQANNMMEVVNKILIKYSYPISLVVIICVIAISSVLLIKLLNKLTPVEMIGGQND
jgi:ABC-type antimicrobial peptide transport system permease subunit